MTKAFMTNGAGLKNIDFPQYPDEAWTWYSGKPAEVSQELYQRVAFIYRAVNLVAGAVASIPFAIVDKAGNEIDNSADWQNKVGFMPDPGTLILRVEQALCIWGGAYLFRERNRARTLGLRYMLPDSIVPTIDPVKGLEYFTRTYTNGSVKLEPVTDLLYFWEPDPWVEVGPPQSSRFMAAANAAGLLEALTLHEIEFIKRGGVLPTMLMVKGMPAAAEREKLESYWDRFIRGWFKISGKIFNAESFDVKTVGEGLEALKDSSFTETNRQDIAAAFGVPLSTLMSNAANYATAMSDRRQFYENTALPACDVISDVMNEQLLAPLGYSWEWRPETIDAFQEDEKERALAYATYIQAGMAPSVAAQVVGIELPPGMEYDDLDPEEAAEPAELEQPEPAAEQPAPVSDVASEALAQERAAAREDMKLSAEGWRDLDIWRRKAVKAHGKGEPLTFAFASDALPADLMVTIRARLAEAQTVEAVKAAFDGKAAQPADAMQVLEAIRLGVQALKFDPGQPRDEAGRFSGDGDGGSDSGESGVGSGGGGGEDWRSMPPGNPRRLELMKQELSALKEREKKLKQLRKQGTGRYLGENSRDFGKKSMRDIDNMTLEEIQAAIAEVEDEISREGSRGERSRALKAAESYRPPEAVQAAARRGLELREKYGRGGLTTQEAGEQGIGSGVARAANLANGDAVSLETIRRMRAFFNRHEKNKAGGEDDAGYIAWQLWGGDAGRAWAERILESVEADNA